MSDLPDLWTILDSYLNTGDYDDDLDGWVKVSRADEDEYDITFESACPGGEDGIESTTFTIRHVK